ncbi:hypothetical protein FACS1894219_04280 [Clostridia bacterium]|nr:hypothetical protein FACS1894219_04280 [Clostridia bacterium]
MLCPNCGVTLPLGSEFCSECGTPLTDTSAAEAGTYAPPPPPAYSEEPPPPPPTYQETHSTPAVYTTVGPGGYNTAGPGGYQQAEPAASGNRFTDFSREINTGRPQEKAKKPGFIIAVSIVAVLAVLIIGGVYLGNNLLKVNSDAISGTWTTTIGAEKGTLTIALDHRGEGTAKFTGHKQLTRPLTAVYENGELTLSGDGVKIAGTVEKTKGVIDVRGDYNIGGEKGSWSAVLQAGTKPD